MIQSKVFDKEQNKISSQIQIHSNELFLNYTFTDPRSSEFESFFTNSHSFTFQFIKKVQNTFIFKCEEGSLLQDLRHLDPDQYISIYSQLLDICYELHQQNMLARCITTKTVYLTQRGQIKLLEYGFYPKFPLNTIYDEYLDIYLIGLIMKELYPLLKQKNQQVEALYQLISQISYPNLYKYYTYACLQRALDKPREEVIQYYESNKYKQNALLIQFSIMKRDSNSEYLFLEEIINESNYQVSKINDLLPPSDFIDTTQEIDEGQQQFERRRNLLIYRFTILDDTITQISLIKSTTQIELVKCFIMKIKLVLCRQILNDLNNNVSVMKISQNLMKQSQNQELLNQLKDIEIKSQSDFQSHFEILKYMISKKSQESYILREEIQNKIGSDLNFEGLKLPYRECLNEFLATVTFSKLDDKFKSKLTLRLTLCLIINKVFDVDNLNISFRKIMQYNQLQTLNEELQHIVNFINQGTNQQLSDLAEDIRKLYFG